VSTVLIAGLIKQSQTRS